MAWQCRLQRSDQGLRGHGLANAHGVYPYHRATLHEGMQPLRHATQPLSQPFAVRRAKQHAYAPHGSADREHEQQQKGIQNHSADCFTVRREPGAAGHPAMQPQLPAALAC